MGGHPIAEALERTAPNLIHGLRAIKASNNVIGRRRHAKVLPIEAVLNDVLDFVAVGLARDLRIGAQYKSPVTDQVPIAGKERFAHPQKAQSLS